MTAKYLLLKDVEGLGRSGDIVGNIASGYVRNKLLPSKLVLPADARAVRLQVHLREERQKKAIQDKKESEDLAQRLEGETISTVVKVDHEGHMYGSVSAADIVHLVEEQLSTKLERRFVQLKHPIKKTGVFEIELKLEEGVKTKIHLKVMSDAMAQQPEEGAEAASTTSEETAQS